MPEDNPENIFANKNIETMGHELGEYFTFIYNETYNLIYKWQEYMELYGRSDKRIELLNESTSSFFALIQRTMLSNIVMNICRLTDSKKDSRSEKLHLTVMRLPELINDVDFRKEICIIIKRIRKSVKIIKENRDNHIAHYDLQSILNKIVLKIPYKDLEETIDYLYQILKIFYIKYYQSDLQKEIVTPLNGAETLIYLLRDGIESRKKKEERIMSGIYLEEDIKMQEPI